MRISKYSTRAPHAYTKNTKSKIQLAIPPRMPVSVLNLYPCVYLLSVGDFCCCCSVRWMDSFNKCYPVANIGSFVVSVLTKVCPALSSRPKRWGRANVPCLNLLAVLQNPKTDTTSSYRWMSTSAFVNKYSTAVRLWVLTQLIIVILLYLSFSFLSQLSVPLLFLDISRALSSISTYDPTSTKLWHPHRTVRSPGTFSFHREVSLSRSEG